MSNLFNNIKRRKYITRYHNTDAPESVGSLMHAGPSTGASCQGAFFTSARPIDTWNSQGRWRVRLDIPKEEYKDQVVPNPVHPQTWAEDGHERYEDGFNSFAAKTWRNYHNVKEKGRVDTFRELSPDDIKEVCVDLNRNIPDAPKNYKCWDASYIRDLAKQRNNEHADTEFMNDSISKVLEKLLVDEAQKAEK